MHCAVVNSAPPKPMDDRQRLKPPYVCIYASQVAVCIGANRHKKISEAVDCMWQRISPHSYYAALQRNGLKTDDQNVMEIMARSMEVKGLMDQSLTLPCDSSDQVAENYGSISRGLDGVDLGEDEKRLVDDTVKRNLYTTYGNLQEHAMLEHIKTRLGIRCRPDPTFYKKPGGYARGGVPWYIGGKIDALSEDGTTVIELKNRVNRLFNKAPFYEVIQVQTYLQLLDVQQGLLVECLKTNKNKPPGEQPVQGVHSFCDPEDETGDKRVMVNVIELKRDDDLWNATVAPKLAAFTDFLLALLDDTRVQDRYLQSKRRSIVVLNHMAAWERSAGPPAAGRA